MKLAIGDKLRHIDSDTVMKIVRKEVALDGTRYYTVMRIDTDGFLSTYSEDSLLHSFCLVG